MIGLELTIFEIFVRLSAALFFGFLIGLERQWKSRTAGLRTNALVSIAAASFTVFGIMSFPNSDSVARVASYVISGMGFLGAGVIMRDGGNVKGINTAATLWCSAAVGLFAGGGFLIHAAILSSFIFLTNLSLSPIITAINRRPLVKDSETENLYSITVVCYKKNERKIRQTINKEFSSHRLLHFKKIEKSELKKGLCQLTITISCMGLHNSLIERSSSNLSMISGLKEISWTLMVD